MDISVMAPMPACAALNKEWQAIPHAGVHPSRERDGLTGLYGRQSFNERLALLLAIRQSDGAGRNWLMTVNVERLGVFNARFGDLCGDALLRQLAALLVSIRPVVEMVARLDGGAFGVLLKDMARDAAVAFAQDVLLTFDQSELGWQGTALDARLNIGLVEIDHAVEACPAYAISAATTACQCAKLADKTRLHVGRLNDEHLGQPYRELQSVGLILRSLYRERFELFFQPIIPLGKGKPEGEHFEILCRMIDDQGRIVRPVDFIPAAERHRLITAIDRQIITKSFAGLRSIYGASSGRKLKNASINISGASVGDDDFLEFIQCQLAAHQIDPACICFEITESMEIQSMIKAKAFIDQLQRIGCQFSLDDFGSGLSSFSYLKEFSVDYIKIDGSFIRQLDTDPVSAEIVKSITRVAHRLGVKVVAEFVDRIRIVKILEKIGVDYVQGNYYAEAMPWTELIGDTVRRPRRKLSSDACQS